MRKLLPLLLTLATPILLPSPSTWAAQTADCRLEVLVNGASRPEYAARGVTYIEALKNQGYEIRLTNPYGVRVAVALSVDGLNTLDARHTDVRSARKWVLEPYQTIVLRGWQTSNDQARRFFFTSEQNSYGQWLGKTENLGVISAAFFRERVPLALRREDRIRPQTATPRASAPAQPAPQVGGVGGAMSDGNSLALDKKQNEYAATGIGNAEDHPVTLLYMDLEDSPAAVVTVRYEYRSALIALGILPEAPVADPLHRREKAHGFVDNGYCPSPK